MLRQKTSQSHSNDADDKHNEIEADDYAEVFVVDNDDDKLSINRLNYLRMSLFKKKQALTI